jgi:predicted kinase
MNTKPTIYLLCGLPGSGKTTYARQLEKNGAVRLSLDEELFTLFGRTFHPERYPEFEKQTKEKLLERAALLIEDKKSTILDWGFWKKKDREEVKMIMQGHGAEVKLLYFKKNTHNLIQGVQNRDFSKNHEISKKMLMNFLTQFEEPNDENEEIVQHT